MMPPAPLGGHAPALRSPTLSALIIQLCRYSLDGELHAARHISMIAGGTGITPMYQVAALLCI